jgi:hypothetical protein
METDKVGLLRVVGGFGKAGGEKTTSELPSYANNDGWWDDTSDGPVSATITVTYPDSKEEYFYADTAWVIVGPPAYAPEIVNLITMYDTMYDIGVRFGSHNTDIFKDGSWNPGYLPDFNREIRPILARTAQQPWVVAIPPKVHAFDWAKLRVAPVSGKYDEYRQLRRYYFEALRPPDRQNWLSSATTGYRLMPYVPGDDSLDSNDQTAKYLTLTPTQYFIMKQWADGKFTGAESDEVPPIPEAPEESHPGEQLTRAHLDNGTGGAFSPGIEITWICRNRNIYPEEFELRFRPIDDLPDEAGKLRFERDFTDGLEPGDVSQFMALPWQADFNQCSSQPVDKHFVWWWPPQRPVFVYAERDTPHMIPEWEQVAWVGTSRDQKADGFVGFVDNMDMVRNWHKLGFVAHAPAVPLGYAGPEFPKYAEVERVLPRDGFQYVNDTPANVPAARSGNGQLAKRVQPAEAKPVGNGVSKTRSGT